MSTRDILCNFCNMKGLIDIPGLNENITHNMMFQYLGHDPFSGEMHFRCPACRKVLAVTPWSVLDGKIKTILKASPSSLKTKKYGRALLLLMVIFSEHVTGRNEALDGFR